MYTRQTKRNYNMKFNLKFIIPLLVISGCSKFTDVIDVNPPNNLDQHNVVQNAEGARSLLNGAYAQLHDQYYYMYTEMVPSVLTGTMARVSTIVNLQFVSNEVNPTLADIRNIWAAFYKLVNHANWVIQLVPTVSSDELTDVQKDEMTAQARALRAMAHFDALRYYGEFYNLDSEYGVVIRTEPADFTNRH